MSNPINNFQIKRLIAVDSAEFAYAEIETDDHSILIADGNIGKSSLLNAMKLFLLPEINFNNCKGKFGFKSTKNNAYYSNDESYRHYFPSPQSFLILEIENPHGTHCQILFSTRVLTYSRAFVSASYDSIRHLFWSSTDDESGIGKAITGLDKRVLDKVAIVTGRNVDTASTVDRLKKILYSSRLLDSESIRYSIFPLPDNEDELDSKVESFRALLSFIFEVGSSGDSIKDAIASIAETEKKSKADSLDFDISEFLNAHRDLELRKKELTRISEMEGDYNRLSKEIDKHRSIQEVDTKFATAYEILTNDRRNEKVVSAESNGARDEITSILSDAQKELDKLTADISAANVILKRTKLEREASERAVTRGEEIIHEYAGISDVDEIIEILSEQRDNGLGLIKGFNSAEESKQLVQKINVKLNKARIEIKRLQESEANRHHRVTQQVDDNSKAILSSLNSKIIKANPFRELTSEEQLAISGFTHLFTEQDNGFSFFDLWFERTNITEGDNASQEIEMLQKIIDNYEDVVSKQEEFQKPENALGSHKEVEKIQKEVTLAVSDIDVLSNLDVSRKTVVARNKDIESLTSELSDASKSNTELSNKIADLKNKKIEANIKCNVTDEKIAALNSLIIECERIIRKHEHLEVTPSDPNIKIALIDNALIDNIGDLMDERFKNRITIINGLNKFRNERIIAHKGLTFEDPSEKTITESFELIGDVYKSLHRNEEVLQKQTKSHNESIQSYIKMLTDNHEHIIRFQDLLNQEFSGVKINNLDAVSLDIGIHHKFINLINDIQTIDIHTSESLPQRFYERLSNFAESFSTERGDARLLMTDIITRFDYRTKKEGSTVYEEKSQSNSTSILINFELAQILLKKIIAPASTVRLPLVLDEAANVSLPQYKGLLEKLTNRGFTLFAASTHSLSDKVIDVIGRHHMIDMMETGQPYNAKRTRVYWGGPEVGIHKEPSQSGLGFNL